MSRQRYFSVMCDGCQLEDNFYPRMADAIAEKRREGWTRHRDGTDHCPDCEAKHRAGDTGGPTPEAVAPDAIQRPPHSLSCEVVETLESGHERCQCQCHYASPEPRLGEEG